MVAFHAVCELPFFSVERVGFHTCHHGGKLGRRVDGVEGLSCSPACVHHTICKHFFQKRPCIPERASTLYPPSRWKHSHHVPLLFKRLFQSRRRRSKPPTRKVWMINDGSAHMPVIWKYSTGDGCQKRYSPRTSCGGKCCTRNSVCGTMANGVVLSGTNVH